MKIKDDIIAVERCVASLTTMGYSELSIMMFLNLTYGDMMRIYSYASDRFGVGKIYNFGEYKVLIHDGVEVEKPKIVDKFKFNGIGKRYLIDKIKAANPNSNTPFPTMSGDVYGVRYDNGTIWVHIGFTENSTDWVYFDFTLVLSDTDMLVNGLGTFVTDIPPELERLSDRHMQHPKAITSPICKDIGVLLPPVLSPDYVFQCVGPATTDKLISSLNRKHGWKLSTKHFVSITVDETEDIFVLTPKQDQFTGNLAFDIKRI